VIIGDPHTGKSQALLQAMGDFVDSLGGRYITAADSGTGEPEMQAFAQRTRHVIGADAAHHAGRRHRQRRPITVHRARCVRRPARLRCVSAWVVTI
jgi:glutamate dehydrogenase/leucine dehydrogenase